MNKIILFLFLFKLSFSYINIHPLFFDKPIDHNGSYQEFTLFNQSSDPILYRIYVEENPKNKEMSMHKWVNFYPRSLTLKPGEIGKIQMSIASHSKLPKGEYSTIFGIREIPIFQKEKTENSNLSVYTDLKMVLNGYAGNIQPNLNFKNLKVLEKNKKIILQGQVHNIGERRGKFELYIDNNFLGNLRIHSNESLNLDNLNFYCNRELITKKPKYLIINDYITKKQIKKIKI